MRWLIALLFILPLAAAGTAEEPEVDDGSGDDSVSSRPLLGAAAANLIKGWYEDAGDDVLFQFTSSGMCADPTEIVEYRWHAFVGDVEIEFGADLEGDADASFCGDTPTSIAPTGVATAASKTSNQATLTIPKSAFGADGTVVTGTYGTSYAYVTSGEAWNDSDRAPDEGGGLDYVLGGAQGVSERATEYHNATERVEQLVNSKEPLDASYVFNWTGPANVTLDLAVVGNGTVNITVIDPTGGQQFACACANRTESLNFTSSAGVWKVNITYNAFQGNSSISLAPTPAMDDDEPGEVPGQDDDVEGNTTDDPETGKDSPAPLFVAVGALLVAARRRR